MYFKILYGQYVCIEQEFICYIIINIIFFYSSINNKIKLYIRIISDKTNKMIKVSLI